MQDAPEIQFVWGCKTCSFAQPAPLCAPLHHAGLGIVVVRQQVPSLLRQAALQLAAAISPADLLQVAVLAEGQPPAAAPAASSQPLLGAVVLGAAAGAQQQAQQAPPPPQPLPPPAAAAGGEEEEGAEEEEGEEGGPEAQMAAMVHHALGELVALLFGLNISAGSSSQVGRGGVQA